MLNHEASNASTEDISRLNQSETSTETQGFNPEAAKRERVIASLDKFIADIESSEDYGPDIEYQTPHDISLAASTTIKKLNKSAIDYSFETMGLKYDETLYSFVGADEPNYSDEEDYNYDEKRREKILEALNSGSLSQDESFGIYPMSEGFKAFYVRYALDDFENATYTADFLTDDKNSPISMTTAVAKLVRNNLMDKETKPESISNKEETIDFTAFKNEVENGNDVNELLERLNPRDRKLNYYALLDMGADEELLKKIMMPELKKQILVDDSELAEFERQKIDHIGKEKYGTWVKYNSAQHEDLLGKLGQNYQYYNFVKNNIGCSFIILDENEKNNNQHAVIAFKDGKYINSVGALQESENDFLKYFKNQLTQLEEDDGERDYSGVGIQSIYPKLGLSKIESWTHKIHGKKVDKIIYQSGLSEKIQAIDDHLTLRDIKNRFDNGERLDKEDYDFIWDTNRLKKLLPARRGSYLKVDIETEKELQKNTKIKDCLNAGVNPLDLAESLFNKQPHLLAYNLKNFKDAGVGIGTLGESEGIDAKALFEELLSVNYLKHHNNYRPILDNLNGFESYGIGREDALAWIEEYRSNLNSSYVRNALKNYWRYQSSTPINKLRIKNWISLQKRDEGFYPFTIMYKNE